jgi:hypothetical protein
LSAGALPLRTTRSIDRFLAVVTQSWSTSRIDKSSFADILETIYGTWRSLVARTLGVREVPSSNLGVPTILINHLRLPALAAVLSLWQICGRRPHVHARLPRSIQLRVGERVKLIDIRCWQDFVPPFGFAQHIRSALEWTWGCLPSLSLGNATFNALECGNSSPLPAAPLDATALMENGRTRIATSRSRQKRKEGDRR